jgi:hypothetical protein
MDFDLKPEAEFSVKQKSTMGRITFEALGVGCGFLKIKKKKGLFSLLWKGFSFDRFIS